MSSADRILDLLDNTLESTPETSYGHPTPPDGVCPRCVRRRAAEGSTWCAGCRAWMLGDTDVDPATPAPVRTFLLPVSAAFMEDAADLTARRAAVAADLGRDLREQIELAMETFVASMRALEPNPDDIQYGGRFEWRSARVTGVRDGRGFDWHYRIADDGSTVQAVVVPRSIDPQITALVAEPGEVGHPVFTDMGVALHRPRFELSGERVEAAVDRARRDWFGFHDRQATVAPGHGPQQRQRAPKSIARRRGGR